MSLLCNVSTGVEVKFMAEVWLNGMELVRDIVWRRELKIGWSSVY